MTRARVLVIGAGPAALSATARLLEEARDRIIVRVAHMGHHIGGKAASYVDGHGRKTEHGWHMVLGFYKRMRGLMRRAGVDETKVLSSMGGQSYPFESWDKRIHTLDGSGGRISTAASFLGYEGLPIEDRLNFGRFMSEAYAIALGGGDLTRHDDICWNTWAIEHGLRPHVTRYSLFRMFREAYFNFPEQISAYHVLRTLSLMSTSEDAEAFVCTSGFSSAIWEPIARYVEKLGATFEPYALVTDWVYEGRKVVGLRAARPDPLGHAMGMSSWSTSRIPIEQGTERTIADFDFVISTIPHAVVLTLNEGDARMWGSPYFARLKNLRSAATVSMTVRTKRPVGVFRGPVFGLPAPLGICVNMTSLLDETRGRSDAGAMLSFVGQEAGFERWSDDQVSAFTLDNFSRIPGFGDVRAAGIEALEIHRNRSDFERILLCEPGVETFRPGPKTPFDNMFFAGDWVKNDVDLICMEGAIASGIEAADLVLSRLHGQ